LKIALLTTDSREHFRDYTKESPYFGTAPTALLEGFASTPNIEVHIISCAQKQMSSPTKLAANVWFHSLYVRKWGWLRSVYSGCILAVRKKLKEINPDIVHAQGTERDCAITAASSPYPWLLTIHGNVRSISKLYRSRPFSYWWLQARLEYFCIRRCFGVMCISSYTQRLVAGLAKQTWIVPNAVNPFFFECPTHPSPAIPLLLVVAHITPHKNQLGLMNALDRLATTRSFRLRFLGNCGDDEYGRRFKEFLRQRKWCEWGGGVDPAALRLELSQATTLVLPTKEDNCPMVILEAQAGGVPVIASRVGGIPDLIEDGVTGILTDPNRPSTMPQAVELLLKNPDLASRLAESGRKQALTRFHPRVVAEKHIEIYREVIASK
jgi:glycosyltransferase involved in cell wall biosynthesis